LDSGLTGTENYSVTLEAVAATPNGDSNGPPTPTCQRGTDGTQPILCGDTKSGSIQVVGETDTYTFTANGGDNVTITTSGLSGGVFPCWSLFAPDGQFLVNAICGQGSTSLPSQSGVYTIKLFDSALDNTGTYNVTLSGPCVPTTTTTTTHQPTTTTPSTTTTTTTTTPTTSTPSTTTTPP